MRSGLRFGRFESCTLSRCNRLARGWSNLVASCAEKFKGIRTRAPFVKALACGAVFLGSLALALDKRGRTKTEPFRQFKGGFNENHNFPSEQRMVDARHSARDIPDLLLRR